MRVLSKSVSSLTTQVLERKNVLELGTCVLAINLVFAFLVFVLVLLQTTHVLSVYYIYNSWVVSSKNCATNNREYSRVHRFPALIVVHLNAS